MLLFVELRGFGERYARWQARASRGVIAHDLHQSRNTGTADAFILGQQCERLFERYAISCTQCGSPKGALGFLLCDARRLLAGFGEIHEATKLPFPAGIVTQQERLEILTANVPLVLVNFYGNIAVTNDVRPRFRRANRLGLGCKRIW